MTREHISAPTQIQLRERQQNARVAALSRLVKISARHHGLFEYCGERLNDEMWLGSDVPLELNHRVTVVFTPAFALEGRVVWVNGVERGIAFGEKVGSAPSELRPHGARRQGRGTANMSNSVPIDPSNPDQCLRPGMVVTVLHPLGLERRAHLNWTHHNVASVELLPESC